MRELAARSATLTACFKRKARSKVKADACTVDHSAKTEHRFEPSCLHTGQSQPAGPPARPPCYGAPRCRAGFTLPVGGRSAHEEQAGHRPGHRRALPRRFRRRRPARVRRAAPLPPEAGQRHEHPVDRRAGHGAEHDHSRRRADRRHQRPGPRRRRPAGHAAPDARADAHDARAHDARAADPGAAQGPGQAVDGAEAGSEVERAAGQEAGEEGQRQADRQRRDPAAHERSHLDQASSVA